jgi:glycosyltransferase involved in cell wall biosynthesis
MIQVSVILTCYNSEKTLQRLLDSIFLQNGLGEEFEIEIIAVDDCSVDSTREILKRNNIECLTTGSNSGGPNKGRNIGLRKATGDFITIADHDDEWLSDRIFSQLQLKDQAPIITSGYTLIDNEGGKRTQRYNASPGTEDHILYEDNITFLNLLAKSKQGQHSYIGSILYSAGLKDILFEEHFGKVDFDWILRLFHKRRSAEICRPLYNRYVSKTNLSLDISYRTADFYYSLMTIENYEEKYPKEVKTAFKRIHGSRARYYYLTGNMPKARSLFLRAGLDWKIILYYLTSYWGSGLVKKHFNVFG